MYVRTLICEQLVFLAWRAETVVSHVAAVKGDRVLLACVDGAGVSAAAAAAAKSWHV